MGFVSAIIVAGGNSTRMGQDKMFLKVGNMFVIERTVKRFLKNNMISEVIIVTKKENFNTLENVFKDEKNNKEIKFALAGNTRQGSVLSGLNMVSSSSNYIAVHDGARPFVTDKEINGAIELAKKQGSATVAVKVKDTIKVVDNKVIVTTPNRDSLYAIQTPQVFLKSLYLNAVQKAKSENKDFTDDCQLVENLGGSVHIFEGKYSNIKITTKEDIFIGEAMLKMLKENNND